MNLLAVRTRSGLVETMHHGALAVVGPDGDMIAWSGAIDTPFFLRSAAKPFQAMVAVEAGADLDPVRLAMACASHDGEPVHAALVESILDEAGLDAGHLRCPPAWPTSPPARDRLVRAGRTGPAPLWNNCSGKHAAWLRACVAQGWPVESYLDPGHPLQRRIVALATDLGGHEVEPVGVDGCGAPVLRTTVRAMALLYARLGSLPRLAPVYTAMQRYPALVSGYSNGDAALAMAFDAVAKRGAEGCLGLAWRGGPGIAAKSWDGLQTPVEVAAVAAVSELFPLSGYVLGRLESFARPPVRGGGEVVGRWEPRLVLERP